MDFSESGKRSYNQRREVAEQISSSKQSFDNSSRVEKERHSKSKQVGQMLASMREEHDKSLKQKEKQRQREMKEVNQFANAWKTQSNLGILLVEKLSLIVHNYFKILPQLAKREEEAEILIVYNRGLLEILEKFESHERKLISKLRSMEEFNVKIMKELCHIKNKPFKPPQIRSEQSLFAKFTLSNFTLPRQDKPEEQPQAAYAQKLFTIFQKYLLVKNQEYLPMVESKIEEFKALGKGQSESELVERDTLENLIQLKRKILQYEEGLKNVKEDQIFNLFELKTAIKQEIRCLGLCPREAVVREEQKEEECQNNFVAEVLKISAGLNRMDQNQIQSHLKMEKETMKRLRKQKIKEQEKFVRAWESVQSQNMQLSQDVLKFKEKVAFLLNEVNVMKAEYDYKKMKIKPHINKSSVFQQSIMIDDDLKSSNKKLVKETHRAMNYDFKKIKEDNQKLQEIVAEYKGKEMAKTLILPKIREKAEKLQIILDPTWEEIKIIQFLLAQLSQNIKEKKSPPQPDPHRDDELVSPNFDERSFYGFQVNPVKYLNTIPEKSEFDPDILENRNKQLQKEVLNLKKKNEEYKNMVTGKSQDLRRVLEDHEATLKQKNGKINQLVKEYERFQSQIKELKMQNNLLWMKWEHSLKLSQNLTKVGEELHSQNLSPGKTQLLRSLASRFEKLNEQFRAEIKKEEQNYEQKKRVSILRGGEGDEVSSRHGNSNDQSIASLLTRNREKRESDMFSIHSKQDDIKPKTKIRNLKSLTNNNESNNNFLQHELEKELSLKKLLLKRNESYSQQKIKQKSRQKEIEKEKDLKQKLKSSNFGKEDKIKKNDPHSGKELDKQEEAKKLDEFSLDSGDHNTDKKKVDKKSATQLGLLKIQQGQRREKVARTEQNGSGSDQKGAKSESYQNKNSNSNSNSNNNHNNNKEEQNAKEMSNFLSFLENNPNDFVDSISERPKQMSKLQFKDLKQENRRKQDKKNKVSMNDALKGSGNLEMFSSRRNRFSLRDDNKKTLKQRKQAKELKQLKDEMSEDKKLDQQKQVPKINESPRKPEPLNLNNQLRMQKSENVEEDSMISVPVIRINNVTRRSENEEITMKKEEEKVENQPNSQINQPSISLDFSKDGSLGKQKSSVINNLLVQPIKNNQMLQKSMTYEKIAQISIEEHEKIMARIQKLGDMDDVLDFIELYNRYKQVLICLDEAEAHIRSLHLRYEKFVNDLVKKKQISDYSIEEELFYLKELVEEQRSQIEDFDKKCNEDMILNIKKSDTLIKEHLKLMREQAKIQKNRQLAERKLFL